MYLSQLKCCFVFVGSLSVKVVKSDSDKEQTFADRVDDNMPHYISLHQADSRSIIQVNILVLEVIHFSAL